MSTSLTPARAYFPRYHGFCDHCGVTSSERRLHSTTFENAAGGFRLYECVPCIDKQRRRSKLRRERATQVAMIRHAMRYSRAFGGFVADWYGVKVTKTMTALAGGAA